MNTTVPNKLYNALIKGCTTYHGDMQVTQHDTKYLYDNKVAFTAKGTCNDCNFYMIIHYADNSDTINGTCSLHLNDGLKMHTITNAYDGDKSYCQPEDVISDIFKALTLDED